MCGVVQAMPSQTHPKTKSVSSLKSRRLRCSIGLFFADSVDLLDLVKKKGERRRGNANRPSTTKQSGDWRAIHNLNREVARELRRLRDPT